MRNLWFLFLLFPAVGLAQNENPLLEAAKFCNETLKDKDLEVLRGKLPLYGENVTPEMLKNYSKPTPNEAKAIQLYLKKKIECGLLMKKAIGQIPGAPSDQTLLEQKSSELINPYQYDAVLAYLMTGFITYADFVRWSDSESKRLKNLAETNREANSGKKAPTLFLACQNELPGKHYGAEFQYQINFDTEAVLAKRGPAQPTNVSIDPTEISFQQGSFTVSISRLTGRYEVMDRESGLLMAGQCKKVDSQRF